MKVSVVPSLTATTIDTPAQQFTEGAPRTLTTIDFTLNQSAQVKWKWSAEDERLLMLGGQAGEVQRQTLEQGWRALAGQFEAYLGTVAKLAASRAVGTAGTAPYGTNTDVLIDAQIEMKRNGSNSRRAHVMSLAASAKLQKLPTQQKVNEAGNSDILREGQLGRLSSFDLLETGFAPTHTKGTGTGYTSTAAGFAIGTTSIPLITGSGTVVAGDCVTFAGDANIYKIKTGVAAPGTIVLQEPGLLQAIPAAATAMTIGNNYTSNLCLGENALKLVVRPSLQVEGAISEKMIITDEKTKLSTLLLRVPGDQQSSWYMRSVFDAFSPNPFEIIDILG